MLLIKSSIASLGQNALCVQLLQKVGRDDLVLLLIVL